ncbi:MAG: glycosyl transferase family 1 [Gemmatimonadaceae bacterium]|nr:glycosyl transferase family 1 [Gloeobacterales cyanobacterium ES-bin-141]
MTVFGVILPAAVGHFDPTAALAHRLQERGHHPVFLMVRDWQQRVEAEGFGYHPVLEEECPAGTWAGILEKMSALDGQANLKYTLEYYEREAHALFRDVPAAVEAQGIEALLVDQTVFAGSTVAEHLGLPFVTLCCALALNRELDIPPSSSPWGYQPNRWGRLRNRLGYTALDWLTRKLRRTLQQQRTRWQLPPLARWNGTYSPFAQISQQPQAFDFPRQQLPRHFHYTGPIRGPSHSRAPAFPFDRLNGRPLLYASLGTIQNRRLEIFKTIAAACAGLEVQLAIAHGGGLDDNTVAQLPGRPIAVAYAPQLEVIRRSAAVITHAGLNTTLDALAHGLPVVALPLVHEQPAIARRILWTGTGAALWPSELNPTSLRSLISEVLEDPTYRQAAGRIKQAIDQSGGVNRAADVCEQVFLTRKPVPA